MAQAALEDRIEQELVENPTLERTDLDLSPAEGEEDTNARRDKENDNSKEREIEQKELVIDEDGRNNADDFERLLTLANDIPDHFDGGTRPSSNRIQESGDRQHDLIANIVDRGTTLQDHLLDQLHEMDLQPELLKMCERIVSVLSAKDGGYLKVSLDDLRTGRHWSP